MDKITIPFFIIGHKLKYFVILCTSLILYIFAIFPESYLTNRLELNGKSAFYHNRLQVRNESDKARVVLRLQSFDDKDRLQLRRSCISVEL